MRKVCWGGGGAVFTGLAVGPNERLLRNLQCNFRF
jgi:hypothetical protein